MEIIVYVKQVPDIKEVKCESDIDNLTKKNVDNYINNDDKAGIEAGIELREKVGGTVTIVSTGPKGAEAKLREGLAMGADNAIFVKDEEFDDKDIFAKTKAVAYILKKIGFDIVITGRHNSDSYTANVEAQLAEILNIPYINYCQTIDVEHGNIIVKSKLDDKVYTMETKAPCIVTALADLKKPKYMLLGGIFAARKKRLDIISRDEAEIFFGDDLSGYEEKFLNVIREVEYKTKKTKEMLMNISDDEAVETIIKKLYEKYLL